MRWIPMAMLLLLPPTLAQADDWTTADTAREVVYLGLHVADWGQTLDIVDHCENRKVAYLNDSYDGGIPSPSELNTKKEKECKYYETNPLLGETPDRGEVNEFFIVTGLAHIGISYVLPNNVETFGKSWNPRAAWQYISIGYRYGLVERNYNLGLRFKF